MENMETLPMTFTQEPIFRKLGKVAKYAALTEHDKRAYQKSLKAYRDAYAIAETERAEGRAEGIAKGRAEERNKSISLMLSFGIPAEKIAEKYGISVEEVREIGE